MKLERKSNLTVETVIEGHLKANVPVIVTDAMESWAAKDLWTPEYLEREFGDARVQVYNDLFMLIGVRKLKDYFDRYFGREPGEASGRRPGYVRWYTRLSPEDRVPWSDESFERMKDQWTTPYFMPRSAYLLPYCGPDQTIDMNTSPFPARGLFISAKGARTALHEDPWGSDAVLCQIHGWKTLRIYCPDQKPYLTQGRKAVDLEEPDLEAFPDFPKAKPTYEDELHPGECVFFPHGWFHHVGTESDSISLTWNFVHMSTWHAMFDYLRSDPPEEELKTIEYFLDEIPGRLI